MTIQFDALDESHGVRVRDTSEGEQFPLRTDRAVDPTPASTDDFTMPVDAAVAIEASELHLSGFSPVIVWQDGAVVHRATPHETAERFGPGAYEIDFSPSGAQLYVYVEDAVVTPQFSDDHPYLETETSTRLVLGVRSHHETPAGTVTVTDDPRDAMAAVSSFGSALKTLSPDRSWPTLRGHPPAIKRGRSLEVPEAVAAPDTGVTIEVPPEFGATYTVAPLAFYLGATVEPGDRPRLLAGDHETAFEASRLADDVRDVLEHVFTLDCVIRSAGVYPFRTLAADTLDERVDVDYEALFELSLAERTAAYMDVPRSATEGLLAWHYTADVEPDAQYAPALPYLVAELAVIRSPPARRDSTTLTPSPDALNGTEGVIARSASAATDSPRPVLLPSDANTPGQCWIGDGFAARGANPTVGSFRRAFEWPDDDGGPLDVHIVYNDARLNGVEPDAYDVHPNQETTVRTSHDLTTSELQTVLSADTDFLHYVGHVTEAGMVCTDGHLDLRTVARTGVSAFFLNGCRSYEQGRALLTAGAVGGLVTVDDVADATAASVGEAVARLLSNGFPLYGILDALALSGAPSDRYSILGDGAFFARQSESGMVGLHDFDVDDATTDPAVTPLEIHSYPAGTNGLGGAASYLYSDTPTDVYSASVTETTLSSTQLQKFLDDTGISVVIDDEIALTDDLTVADFR